MPYLFIMIDIFDFNNPCCQNHISMSFITRSTSSKGTFSIRDT